MDGKVVPAKSNEEIDVLENRRVMACSEDASQVGINYVLL